MKKKVLVSACLVGLPVRYNAKGVPQERLISKLKEDKIFFFCPEQSAGLPTPREPAEIESGKTAAEVLKGEGRVLTKTGVDQTSFFVRGAQLMLDMCKKLDIDTVILKSKSPSCGVGLNYDGTFSGNLITGNGITAELLQQNGITAYTEDNFPEDLLD